MGSSMQLVPEIKAQHDLCKKFQLSLLTVSKIQLVNTKPHSAANSFWQTHGIPQFLKADGPLEYLWDFPSYAQATWLVMGFENCSDQKYLLCGVELSSKSCFLRKIWLHLHPTSMVMWGKLPCRQQSWSSFPTFKPDVNVSPNHLFIWLPKHMDPASVNNRAYQHFYPSSENKYSQFLRFCQKPDCEKRYLWNIL